MTALDKLFRQKLGTAHPALAQKVAGRVDNGGMNKSPSFEEQKTAKAAADWAVKNTNNVV